MSALQWHILGGNNQHNVGANSGLCTYDYEDENGKSCRKTLLFDAGVLMNANQRKPEDPALEGLDTVMPDFDRFFYKANDPSHIPERPVDSIFLTHNHVDHVGALSLLLLMGYKLPKIYTTPYTARRLEQELSDAGVDPNDWKDLISVIAPGKAIQEGPVNVTAFWVSHSTPQSVGFFIDTPEGTILHTGDFKMDGSVLWGPAFSEEQFRRVVSKPVDMLLLDSTGADQDKHQVTEQDVCDSLHELIAKNPGKRLIVAVTSGYEETIATVAKVAAEEKRIFWVAGAAHEQTLEALDKTGMNMARHVGANLDLRVLKRDNAPALAALPPDQSIVVVTGSQGHDKSVLASAAAGTSYSLKLDPETDIIVFCAATLTGQMSQREQLLKSLRSKGFMVLTNKEMPLYSHAHARLPEMIEMVKLANPKHTLPIHGSKALREACAVALDKLGRKVLRADNGDVIRVSQKKVESTQPATKGAARLIGIMTMQQSNKWQIRHYFQVKAPAAEPANGNKKHKPRFFDLNP